MKITHITSAHPRYDTRIFVKECKSLAKVDGYDVSLIVADGKSDERKDNVQIYDVGRYHGRLKRMFLTTRSVYQKAIMLDSDIYHLHDPELLSVGLKLKKLGKRVIFDAHEDTPVQILGKTYLNIYLRKILSLLFSRFEKYAVSKFDAVVCATPYIRDKFSLIVKSVDINNYPLLQEFKHDQNWKDKNSEICYIGGISKDRGILEIVKSLEYVKECRLNLAGDFKEVSTENIVRNYSGWEKVNELGYLSREGVKDVLKRSKAGLVILRPLENYKVALPVKMFEYMSANIPVIVSNFPLWKEIILSCDCGIIVDPFDTKEIAKAINYILQNPDIAKEMGIRGREAVEKKYNWSIQEKKLYKLYRDLS